MPVGQPNPAPSAAISEINQALSIAAAQSSSSTDNYRIGPEDLVQVTVYNIPEQDARVTPRTVILRVSQEGAIVLPLIGEVPVKGKTIGEVEQDLKTRYASISGLRKLVSWSPNIANAFRSWERFRSPACFR